MARGRVELSSLGIQDEYITGDPQITFFHKNFKRHSKFSLDVVDCELNGTPGFGNTVDSIIDYQGDVIRTLYAKVTLPPIVDAAINNLGYTDSIGYALFEHIDLFIGGQLIERLTGELMDIYSELWVSDSKQRALSLMVGKTGSQFGLGNATTSRELIVPLSFYFHNDPSMAIPLCALTRQNIELNIKTAELSKLVVCTASPHIVPANVQTDGNLKLSISVEYAYLSPDEIDTMRSRSLKYLITQTQLSRAIIKENETTVTTRVNFTNPTKEFIIICKDKLDLTNNVLSYNNDISSISINFNEQEKLSETVGTYMFLRYGQALTHHTRVPTKEIYIYSFGLLPESNSPTGQVNMSRIFNKLITFNTTGKAYMRDVRIYARSFNILVIENGVCGVLFNTTTNS